MANLSVGFFMDREEPTPCDSSVTAKGCQGISKAISLVLYAPFYFMDNQLEKLIPCIFLYIYVI